MPTRSQLLKLADEAAADIAKEEKIIATHTALLAELRQWKRKFEEAAAALAGTNQDLHKSQRLSIIDNSMTEAHKLAISRGHGKAKRKDAEFAAAIRKSGYTQNSLARRLGVDPALLSRYRRGERPVPQERAEAVRDITGWPADVKHWPGGIVPRD